MTESRLMLFKIHFGLHCKLHIHMYVNYVQKIDGIRTIDKKIGSSRSFGPAGCWSDWIVGVN